MTSNQNNVGLPHNKNPLSPLAFGFKIERLPSTNFFVTRVGLPGLSATPPSTGTPFRPMVQAFDKLTYEDLTLTFKVDEDLRNWQEIADWMVGVGFPASFEERRFLESSRVPGTQQGKFSDGTLIVRTSKKNPNVQFMFKDLIPYSISSLEFTTQDPDVSYIEATVSFRYLYYTIERLRNN